MKTNKTKYGDIIKQLFEFVKENEPVSYTDMNAFYQMEIKGKATYDSVNDRGGSFPHHLVSMKNKSRRNYSGRVEYLIKERGVRGKYYAYTLQGDREILSTFCKPTKRYLVKTDIGTFKNVKAKTAEEAKAMLLRDYICRVEKVTLQEKKLGTTKKTVNPGGEVVFNFLGGKPKETVNAISDDLFNFLGEIGALGGNAKETYNEDKQKCNPIKSDLAKPSDTKVRLETIISDLTELIERLEKDSLKKKYYNFKDPIAEYQKDDKIIQGLFRQRSLYGEALNGYTAYQQAIKKAQSFENTATGFLTK